MTHFPPPPSPDQHPAPHHLAGNHHQPSLPSPDGPPGAHMYASWGARLAAQLIDAFIVGGGTLLLIFVFMGSGVALSGSDPEAGGAVALGGLFMTFLLLLVVSLLYAPVLMARKGSGNGQTFGKQALGIRVIRDDGQLVSFGTGAAREIGVKTLGYGILSGVVPVVGGLAVLAAYLWPLWDDENRAPHDMAVKTHVVKA